MRLRLVDRRSVADSAAQRANAVGVGKMTRMWTSWHLLPFVVVVGLAGCATVPAGPSEMVLPGEGKPFEQFQAEDTDCRQWANTQVGTTPGQAWTESALS